MVPKIHTIYPKMYLNTNQRITYNIIILSTNLAMHPVRQPMIIKQFNRCIDQILHKFSKGRSSSFDLTWIKSFENVVILGSKFKLISVATNESFKGMSDEEKLCWALSICIECILGIQMIGHCIGPGSTNLKIGRKKVLSERQRLMYWSKYWNLLGSSKSKNHTMIQHGT